MPLYMLFVQPKPSLKLNLTFICFYGVKNCNCSTLLLQHHYANKLVVLAREQQEPNKAENTFHHLNSYKSFENMLRSVSREPRQL